MALKDLTGQQIGKFKIIKRGEDYHAPGGQKTVRWIAQCECGKVLEQVSQYYLTYADKGCFYCRNSRRDKIVIGNKYGKFTVLSIAADRDYRIYNIRCDCGYECTLNAYDIYKFSERGCRECRKLAEIDKLKEAEVGRTYGEVTVLDLFLGPIVKKPGATRTTRAKCRCSCGREFDTTLSRLKKGGCKTCGHNTEDVLRRGRELSDALHVEGTSISALTQRRSKNNTSGIKGVSRTKKGLYRAYITFRYKQYGLGEYARLEDAAAARKAAEERIFGNFLEWYNTTHKEDNT